MRAVRRVNVTQNERQDDVDRYSVQVVRGGKPVDLKTARVTATVEEEVMTWMNATHIHTWIVKNVMNGKEQAEPHNISEYLLGTLLSTCEKVLNASQLVIEPTFKPDAWNAIRERMKPLGASPLRIRNISTAYRLLPVGCNGTDRECRYDEDYLKVVRATRDWAERMLIDKKSGVEGNIYYSFSKVW